MEDNKIYYGEPIERDLDIGLATYHSNQPSNTSNPITPRPAHSDPDPVSRAGSDEVVRVKVWEMETPWDGYAHFTGKVMGVKKLLTPVPVQGSIRAVGLNYKDHAVGSFFDASSLRRPQTCPGFWNPSEMRNEVITIRISSTPR